MVARSLKLRCGTTLLASCALLGAAGPARAETAQRVVVNDASRLNPTPVHAVVQENAIAGLQAALAEARGRHLKVSIAGKRHSMGGHAFYEDAVVLDMTSFNKILTIDPVAKTITVQSGATWSDVIEAANKQNLAIEVMQAYAGFTVGGSMSVNVHESDPRFGPMIGSVKSFRLLLADGSILRVSRDENAELFGLVIGGYGLFGVILDVDLALVENRIYRREERVLDYHDYGSFFRRTVSDGRVEKISARLSIAPNASLLRETVVTTYRATDVPLGPNLALRPPRHVKLARFFFGLSRRYAWGKRFRWYLQREHSGWVEPLLNSRNNVMNRDLGFLAYSSRSNTDILQEYFVPIERLAAFIDELREVVVKNRLNLLNATIRYVPRNEESVLSYSLPEASFGVVLYFNMGVAEKEQADAARWTRVLIDRALAMGGTYYLPYLPYATREQFEAAYPRARIFAEKKLQYDPQELFMSSFYETYLRPPPRQ